MDLIIIEAEKKKIKEAERLLIMYAALKSDVDITDALIIAIACMKACRLFGIEEVMKDEK